jgi:O6-methylguanine-DNA--protein-cysteine methyltransferase
MSDDKIKKALQEAEIGETITCPQAFIIAEKAKVSRSAVGEYCTKNRIKIRSCQLGCFK